MLRRSRNGASGFMMASTTHDVDGINAALRLGAKVIFPIGAVVAFYDDSHVRIVGHGRFAGDIRKGAPLYLVSGESTAYFSGVCIQSVVSIPDDAPPFDQWERYE